MKAITELIVRVADLVEAEGRSVRSALRADARALRESAGRFTLGAAMTVAAAVLLLIGACLCVATVYAALEPSVGVPMALLASGLFSMACGGLVIWFVKKTLAG